MQGWTLPVLNSNSPRNTCGECKECCTVLPISEKDWIKPAGQTCAKLCDTGCSIYGQPEWPHVCRTYLCAWRNFDWVGNQADCRPDRLGVIIQAHSDVLALFETRPQGAYGPKVSAVVRKFSQKYKGPKKLRVNVYQYKGLTWNNETLATLQGIPASEANWMLHLEPYEHFILEPITSQAVMNARTLLAFFATHPERYDCRLGVQDNLLEMTKVIHRDQIPELEAIAKGKEPGPELSWMTTFPLAGLTAYSGGSRVKSLSETP